VKELIGTTRLDGDLTFLHLRVSTTHGLRR
jgi:hypothetical protein